MPRYYRFLCTLACWLDLFQQLEAYKQDCAGIHFVLCILLHVMNVEAFPGRLLKELRDGHNVHIILQTVGCRQKTCFAIAAVRTYEEHVKLHVGLSRQEPPHLELTSFPSCRMS